MGYDTEFRGYVTIDPPLNTDERSYMKDFCESRRVRRLDGKPYVITRNHDDVESQNGPPEGQPGLWCDWRVSDDGMIIEWSGMEKFYNADQWMRYLIDHFLSPGAYAQQDTDQDLRLGNFTFNHIVNGVIYAQGEDPDDKWMLSVENNAVYVSEAIIQYGERKRVQGS